MTNELKTEMKFRTINKHYVEIKFNTDDLKKSDLYFDGYKFVGYPYLAGCDVKRIGFVGEGYLEMNGKKYQGILLDVSHHILEEFKEIVRDIRLSR